jgi:hypothetical protein
MFIGLIKKAREGLLGVRKNGTIIYSTINTYSLIGYTHEELKNKSLDTILNNNSIVNEMGLFSPKVSTFHFYLLTKFRLIVKQLVQRNWLLWNLSIKMAI